jgi:chloride channel protein, CIC family
MLYELSATYEIILPLMVTTTIGSALCHALIERRGLKVVADEELLTGTEVRRLMVECRPMPAATRMQPMVELLLAAEDGVLGVLDGAGRIYGVVQIEHLRDVWRDDSAHALVVAQDVARRIPAVNAGIDLATALARMDEEDVDALPVIDFEKSLGPYGVITRTAIRRFLFGAHARRHRLAEEPVAPTELPR